MSVPYKPLTELKKFNGNTLLCFSFYVLSSTYYTITLFLPKQSLICQICLSIRSIRFFTFCSKHLFIMLVQCQTVASHFTTLHTPIPFHVIKHIL